MQAENSRIKGSDIPFSTNKQFAEKRDTLLHYRSYRARQHERHPIDGHLKLIFDEGSFQELWGSLSTKNPLSFEGYEDKLQENVRKTGARDACIAGTGTVNGIRIVGVELSREFLMGSMGTAAGEKITRAFEEADRLKLPIVVFSASGGARMQEGMFSLMQMAKTSAAVKRFQDRGGLYISVLTDPTTGGVSASYASLGDITLAEPGALIGFAGPRVIEQTIGEKLPVGFQRSEFQQQHGFVDRIVPPEKMKEEIAEILRLHRSRSAEVSLSAEPKSSIKAGVAGSAPQTGEANSRTSLTAYDRVMLARDKDRPKAVDFISGIFDDFYELRGDHIGKEDPAILGGIALLDEMPVTVISHRKGKNLKENLACNFGMPEPQGYRKALRLMRQAEKFGRPVVTLIDTPGAYPGREAEENGQSIAIAENLAEMSALKVPIIAIVTGEGNSGGALAIGVGDEIWMLENAVYSVLSPEGFASILWKDSSRMKDACDVMKMTAADLYEAGIADRIIREPEGGIQNDFGNCCRQIREMLIDRLSALLRLSPDELTERRYQKYRHFEGSLQPAEDEENK